MEQTLMTAPKNPLAKYTRGTVRKVAEILGCTYPTAQMRLLKNEPLANSIANQIEQSLRVGMNRARQIAKNGKIN